MISLLNSYSPTFNKYGNKIGYSNGYVPQTYSAFLKSLKKGNRVGANCATCINYALEDMGLIVERVEDGIQCVAKMEQMPAKSYDLILMDVQMPHMDGYKATETIRELSDEGKAHIPIVALTANAFEEDRKMAISKGMNDHIAKPIDVKKVEEVIISVLK